MSTLKFLSIPTKKLNQSITSASSSFKVSNIEGWDGNDLTSGDLGEIHYVVFRNPTNTLIEIMEIDPTTIASASITINKRGLDFNGDLTTEVSANKLDWPANETLIELGTDAPQTLQWVKEYIDGIAISGSPDSSTTVKGIGKVSVAPASSSNPIFVGDNDPRVPTAAQVGYIPTSDQKNALAGNDGTPSTSNKYVTESGLTAGLATITGSTLLLPVVRTYLAAASPATWTKPAGLKYIVVEVQAAGGSSGGTQNGVAVAGAGGGGYTKKKINAADLGATETITIGSPGPAGISNGTNPPTAAGAGTASSFGSHCSANPGAVSALTSPGDGGSATGGDINIPGQAGSRTLATEVGGDGGDSHLGNGGRGAILNGNVGTGYGGGASGGYDSSSNGALGAISIVSVIEYYL